MTSQYGKTLPFHLRVIFGVWEQGHSCQGKVLSGRVEASCSLVEYPCRQDARQQQRLCTVPAPVSAHVKVLEAGNLVSIGELGKLAPRAEQPIEGHLQGGSRGGLFNQVALLWTSATGPCGSTLAKDIRIPGPVGSMKSGTLQKEPEQTSSQDGSPFIVLMANDLPITLDFPRVTFLFPIPP